MADLQTPTEATLLSTSNSATEYATPTSKEAGTQVSLIETAVPAANAPTETEPAPVPPVTTTKAAMNGVTNASTNTATLTNGTTYTPAASSAIAAPLPATTSAPATVADGPAKNGKLANLSDYDDPPLFSPSLISEEVVSRLPEGYTIRPLRRSDYYGGFLPTLRVLTTVGEPTLTEFNARYDFISSRNDTYYILVICDETSTVVGTGAVIVERKFIHNMGLVGHIEDIAVAKNQQGKKLGLRIIQALDAVAERVGCYKSILDCSEANEGFYVKCGFKRAGLEMAHYYEQGPKTSYERS
ncbi:glucosamine-phosphate N-acetyltransferase [Cladophialophora psammophila CBS 110553]|uniref:Glucosamine 6-phosphate N-acetyltransferase n=1 Tax=Cladophialophora psammophila CBS 110553 TaxID=1182543 RepID=W9X585_9EURO|nr:glucosamine-phosphate N-acetyltransferase [Cladophialophora psammophila CBS 110553]EXJ72091.1 glucosamine-phosphate N-acetyltransferase [Cladophialophora psammophila CBS 110553]